MTVTIASNRHRLLFLFGGLFLLIVGIEHVVTTLPIFSQRSLLPVGVTLDLVVVLPVLFYFLVARPYRLALTSMGAAVGAGLGLAYWILPLAQQAPLRALHLLPALLELLTLVVAATKFRRMQQAYRAAHAQDPRFAPSLRAAIGALGATGTFMLAELDLLRYAVLGWWATPETAASGQSFTNYRESGFTAFAVTVALVLAVETTVVHLLVDHWSPRVANWVLFFEVYAVVTCIAHLHAVRLRPAQLSAGVLVLRVGCMWEVTVPLSNLLAVEVLRTAPARRADTLNLTPLLFTTPNLLLTFAEPVAVAGPYGTRRTARRLAVYLDEPQPFIAATGLYPNSQPR